MKKSEEQLSLNSLLREGNLLRNLTEDVKSYSKQPFRFLNRRILHFKEFCEARVKTCG